MTKKKNKKRHLTLLFLLIKNLIILPVKNALNSFIFSEEKRYIIKISIINTLGFYNAVITPALLDPQLKSHVIYGVRKYAFGHWIVGYMPMVFFLTYIMCSIAKKRIMKITSPVLALLTANLLMLFYFFPEFPHINLLCWTFVFCFTILLISWIHYLPIKDDFVTEKKIKAAARIEKIKEMVSAWKTFFISLAVAYVTLFLEWLINMNKFAEEITPDKQEQLIFDHFSRIQVAVFSTCVIFGLFVELMKRIKTLTDLFLKIEE